MTYVVLDSGIYIASVFLEPYTTQAKHLMKNLQSNRVIFVAPHLLMYELVSTIRKGVYQGRVSLNDAVRIRDRLLNQPIDLYLDQPLLKRAYDLATELNRVRAYDTQFLALAERFNCDFWTTDEKFYNIAYSQYPLVRWIGNYKTP